MSRSTNRFPTTLCLTSAIAGSISSLLIALVRTVKLFIESRRSQFSARLLH